MGVPVLTTVHDILRIPRNLLPGLVGNVLRRTLVVSRDDLIFLRGREHGPLGLPHPEYARFGRQARASREEEPQTRKRDNPFLHQ